MSIPASNTTSIAQKFPVDCLWLRGLLLLAAIALVVGLTLPIVTIEKFIFFENTFSVLSGTKQLLVEGKYFLFAVITGFSIILPLLKLYVLLRLLLPSGHSGETMRRYLHLMHLYGKWSMLDVFVVAILVVSVKLGAIANVQMQSGLYAFAGAVILMMLITARVVQLTDQLDEE